MLPLCDSTRELFAPLKHGLFEQDVLELTLIDNRKFIADVYREHKSHAGEFPKRASASHDLKEVLRRLPECKPLVPSHGFHDPYTIGGTDCSVEIISALVPPRHIRFVDTDTRNEFMRIQSESFLADTCAQLIAEYKCNKVVPQHPYEFSSIDPLADYQQVGLVAAMGQPGFLLSMEQGTGKTPIAIAAMCNDAVDLRKKRTSGSAQFQKTLIVCPKGLRSNWVHEICKFSTRPGRITVMEGTQLNRAKQLLDAFAVDDDDEIYFSAVIVGYQMLWRSWEALQLVQWDMSIIDEAHNICTVKAEQSKGAIAVARNSARRLALTGTPIKNSPLDIYNILEFLDEGGSGFSEHRNFRKFYGVFDRAPTGHDILIGFENLPIMQERLARKAYFIPLKEALPDLPEKTYDIVEVEMTKEQEAAYHKLERELALSIDEQISSGKMPRSMLVTNILTQLLRLSQITSGFVTWSPVVDPTTGLELQPKEINYFHPNPKIDLVMEILREKQPHEKTIIWANWIPDIEYIVHAARNNGIDCVEYRGLYSGYTDKDREEAVRRFNEDRDCKVFVGTPASGGAGLNLLGYPPGNGDDYETNCNHTIYFSQNWSQVHRSQSEFRNHRRGVRVSTRFTTLICTNSIDEEIHDRVTQKRETAATVADLRQILSTVLSTTAIPHLGRLEALAS